MSSHGVDTGARAPWWWRGGPLAAALTAAVVVAVSWLPLAVLEVVRRRRRAQAVALEVKVPV